MSEMHDDMQAAIVAPVVRPILLFKGVFANSTVRYWTGLGDLSAMGETFNGVGDLVSASEIESTDEMKAAGVEITVKGIKSSDIAFALTELKPGSAGTIWLALLDESGAVVDEPETLFRGKLDVGTIKDGAESALIVLNYEHELIDLERPRERRYTHEEQIARFPGDLGLEYIAGLQDKELIWGRRG